MSNLLRSPIIQFGLAAIVCATTVGAAVHFSGAYNSSFRDPVKEAVEERAREDYRHHEGLVQISATESVNCSAPIEDNCEWRAYYATAIFLHRSDKYLGHYCIKTCDNNEEIKIKEIRKIN